MATKTGSRWSARWAAVLVLALALAACGGTQDEPEDAAGGDTPAGDDQTDDGGGDATEAPTDGDEGDDEAPDAADLDPLRIGAILPQTGPLAPIGAGLLRGTTTAVEWWNAQDGARAVELQQCDDQSTAEAALGCYRQLAESTDVIVGPHVFFQYAAVKELAAADGPVLLTAVPFSDPPADSFVFQSQPNIRDVVEAELDYSARNGLTRVATLTADDEPGNIGKEAAAELAGEHGVEIVEQQVFDTQAQNLAPQAQNIATADPDVVISWVLGPPLVTSLRALFDAGVEAPVLMASGSMSAPLLEQAGEQTPPELLFFASETFEPERIADEEWQARVTSFTELFESSHGQLPDFNALAAADTVLFPASAAHEHATTSPDELRQALQDGEAQPSFLWNTYTYTQDDHKGASGSGYSALLWDLGSKSWSLAE